MPRLEFSNRFAEDLSAITSARVEAHVMRVLDCIEAFGEFGTTQLPDSIVADYGPGVRKVSVKPFDLIYSLNQTGDVARIEALVSQRSAW